MSTAIQGQITTSRGPKLNSLVLTIGCLGALFIIVGTFILHAPSQSARSRNEIPSNREASNVVGSSSISESSPQVQVEAQQPTDQSQSTLNADISISSDDGQVSGQITVNDTVIELGEDNSVATSTIKQASEGSSSTSNLSVKISNNATGEAPQDTRTRSSIDISSSSDNGETTIKSRERIR